MNNFSVMLRRSHLFLGITSTFGKVKTMDFSETIAASDLKVGRCRQLIEFMKVCEF